MVSGLVDAKYIHIHREPGFRANRGGIWGEIPSLIVNTLSLKCLRDPRHYHDSVLDINIKLRLPQERKKGLKSKYFFFF